VLAVERDFASTKDGKDAGLRFIHRRDGDAEIYFVANPNERFAADECTFRIAGKAPELWHPDTGVMEPAAAYSGDGKTTTVPIRFDPYGSVFVVFRKPAARGGDPVVSVKRGEEEVLTQATAQEQPNQTLEIRKATWGVPGGPATQQVDVTSKLAGMVHDGKLSVAATNDMAGSDPAKNVIKKLTVEYAVDGKPMTRVINEKGALQLPDAGGVYDGHPAAEPGAVVCRVAPSFTRFGNFQLPASRGDVELLRRLVDFTIRTDFPHLAPGAGEPITEATIGAWFDEVCARTATLVVHWMRVGFVHGVLNTDNLSILGLTIDYGPYGWLEDFDPNWTPNTTDAATRRYRYGQQPQVAHWNLLQLANAIAPLFADDLTPLQQAIDGYGERYRDEFQAMLAARLGWGPWQDGDDERTGLLFQALVQTEVDQVIFFRNLAGVPVEESATDDELLAPLADAWYQPHEVVGPVRQALVDWLRVWAARVRQDDHRAAMDALNPRFVLRNYLAQEAIDAAEQGDLTVLHQLHEVLRRPYDEQPGQERFSAKRPDWARTKVGCSMLSCSS
jgi:uncharacterized protein YdiU (UPF0061 family)